MDNSIIRSGQDLRFFLFLSVEKQMSFCQSSGLPLPEKSAGARMTKFLESTKEALHLITGICRAAYDYKIYNLFFFLGKDA